MRLDFLQIEEKTLPHFKGGEKEFHTRMLDDGQNKIMQGRLQPGATIGFHTHVTSSEIIFILHGTATFLYDDAIETVHAGECHYCPKGHSHSLLNNTNEELCFWAVVPEQ